MKRVAILILLGLIASACRIEVDLRVDLQPDGSGDIDLTITTDEEFEDLYRLTGADLEGFIANRGQEIGLNFEITEGVDTVYHADAQALSAEGLKTLLEGLIPNLGTVEINATEEQLEFVGDFKPLPDADLLLPFFTNFDPSELAENADVKVTLTVPGDVELSTATLVEGNVLTFELPFENEPIRIFARSRLIPEDTGGFPWGLALVLAVGAGALAFLVAIRRTAGGGTVTQAPLPESLQVPYAPEDQPVAPPQQEPVPADVPSDLGDYEAVLPGDQILAEQERVSNLDDDLDKV